MTLSDSTPFSGFAVKDLAQAKAFSARRSG